MASDRFQNEIGFFRSLSPEQKEKFRQLLEEDKKSEPALSERVGAIEQGEAGTPIPAAVPERQQSHLLEAEGKEEKEVFDRPTAL